MLILFIEIPVLPRLYFLPALGPKAYGGPDYGGTLLALVHSLD